MSNGSEQLIDELKALADPTRLRMLMLCANGECSVSELTGVLALSQPRVSQHLKRLCDAGFVERFRDGHFVFYRLATGGEGAARRRRMLALVPNGEAGFARDLERLRALRGQPDSVAADDVEAGRRRSLHRALVAQTMAAPLGDLLDIGCGQGRVLKLLASRAHRAVGVDIDSDARRFARAELLTAGLPNCTLRQGDMYALPFHDASFDTIVVDDVLGDAERPLDVLAEATRLLRSGGRILLLASTDAAGAADLARRIAGWCAASGLRLGVPAAIPVRRPDWLLAVATHHDAATEAA